MIQVKWMEETWLMVWGAGGKTHIEPRNTASKYETMTESIKSCLPTPTRRYLCVLFLFIISQWLETRPSDCFPFLKRDYCGFLEMK